jgi:hypothetical protein
MPIQFLLFQPMLNEYPPGFILIGQPTAHSPFDEITRRSLFYQSVSSTRSLPEGNWSRGSTRHNIRFTNKTRTHYAFHRGYACSVDVMLITV